MNFSYIRWKCLLKHYFFSNPTTSLIAIGIKMNPFKALTIVFVILDLEYFTSDINMPPMARLRCYHSAAQVTQKLNCSIYDSLTFAD